MLSVIVLSSDGYSDCWEPLFMSFKKYFEGIEEFELILSTNNKSYSYDGLDIKMVKHGDEKPWSKRLKNALLTAKNEITLVLVEDFFLRAKLPNEELNLMISLMKDKGIDHIRLINSGTKFKTIASDYPLLEEISPKTNHRFLYLPGLWKKEVLIEYLADHEMPYMAEKMANVRSRYKKHNFYAVGQEYIKANGQFYLSSSSGAIYKGKWVSWVEEFLKSNGITIDLEIRGVGDPQYNKSMRNKTLIGLAKQPVPTFKSLWSILTLYLKTKLRLNR